MDVQKKLHEEEPHGRSSSRYYQKGQADKLKNETTARKAIRAKFRHGKKDIELTPEEKKKIKKLQVQGRQKINHDLAENRAVHKKVDEANQDDNVGTKSLNAGVETAENVADVTSHSLYSRKMKRYGADGPDVNTDSSAFSGLGGKLGENARSANAKAGNSNYGAGKQARAAQKNLMKKEFQRAAAKKSQAEAANQVGNISRKFVDKAEDLAGRLAEWVTEFLSEHPMILLVALVILVIILVVGGCSSSAGILTGALSDSTVATSYTADDAEILAVDENYSELETDLQEEIADIATDNPGYDEYQYTLSEINHNPYQLAALLTVLYEDYTEEEVEDKLQEIFDAQYELTLTPVTETRTRTETRTGIREVVNDDGSVTYEEYTYEVEVEYEWKILKVNLTNETMDAVVRNMGLSEDQMKRYELLLETQGNKAYLFSGDVYATPTPSEYEDYDIPAEMLTDQEFANMIREAEKYLDMEYVWGGSSPSTGFDCSGFVSYVINHCGNGWNVGRQTANGLLVNCCTRVSKANARPGDLIFFKGTYNTIGASHVGIYVGNGMMIHCGNPIKYSSIETNYWRNHFYTFGRIKD